MRVRTPTLVRINAKFKGWNARLAARALPSLQLIQDNAAQGNVAQFLHRRSGDDR
jgi:hypothetical protein